jgi:CheY-like chemotaxis protein
MARGTESVLVVDDEPLLRALAVRTLGGAGYRCLEAADAAEAMQVVEREQGRLDLVVTDVVMPGMSGGSLGDQLAVTRPGLRVLYTSGYTDEDASRRGLLARGKPFLQKPFSPNDLAHRVREILDASSDIP